MPGGGLDPLDVFLFIIAIIAIIAGAGLIFVLVGGAFQSWRRWSEDRRIRKHLRK